MKGKKKLRDVARRNVLKSGAALSGGLLLGSGSAAAEGGLSQSESGGSAAIQSQDGTLACGDAVSGQLTPDDDTGFRGPNYAHDTYQLTVDEDTFVNISLTTGAGEGDPYLYLLDSSGTIVAEDDDSGGNLNSAIRRVRVEASETYTILATSFSEQEYFSYRLSTRCFDPTPETTIQCGETIRCALGPDDDPGDDARGFRGRDFFYDVFGFSGAQGQRVNISMMTPEPESPDAGDPHLYLLNPGGTIIARDDNSGLGFSALVTADLPREGEYTIVATSSAPDSRFRYDLSLDCPTPQSEPISCGETVSGSLSPDDASGFRGPDHYQDRYTFDGTAGEYVTVSLGAVEGSYADSYLYLLGPGGSIIAEDDDSGVGFDSLLTRRLPQDGEYTIVATSYGAEAFFEYELSLGCQPGPICPPDCEDPIGCGAIVDGALAPGDSSGFRGSMYYQDVYCLDAEPGTELTISLSGEEFSDPYLYLVGPNGEVVAQDDDSGGELDSLIQQYPVEQAGRYKIIATSYAPGTFFEYNLTLQCQSN